MEYSDSNPENVAYVIEIQSMADFNNLYLKLPQTVELPRYEGMEDAVHKKREELARSCRLEDIAHLSEKRRRLLLISFEKAIYSFLTERYPLLAAIDEFCIGNPDFDYRGISFLATPKADSSLVENLSENPIIRKYWDNSVWS